MSSFVPPPKHTTRPTLTGSFGMVASTHWIASASAQSVLERGGNAFDATVVGAFVLHVVEPHLNGPGGDLTGIFARGDAAKPIVLVGQGPAPAAASIEHYRSLGMELVPGAGALASAVPGSVDALLMLLRDHGTWEVPDVFAYAIDYAENGVPILANAARTIAGVVDLFRDHWPTSAECWLVDGEAPQPGDVVRLPGYAQTLRRLAAASQGRARADRIDAVRDTWGSGFVAEAIEEFIKTPHRHADGGDYAGVLTRVDMASWSASYEEPVTLDVAGATVCKVGPWSQGPVLLQALAILDGFSDAEVDPGTVGGAHRILEALKLALADRDAHYGDPDDPSGVPIETLLSIEYAATRRALIGQEASYEFRPGQPDGRVGFVPPLRTASEVATGGEGAVGEPTVQVRDTDRGDTCHLDVVDRWGNLVALTPSGGWLQSSPTIPELGFCLGTRLQMSWLDPSAPSALRAGRRPRTTLSPTLLMRDGVPFCAMGTPGGDQQDQWQLSYLLRVLRGGYTLQQAIDAPSLHTTSLPGSFWPRTWTPGGAVIEDRVGPDVIDGLRRRGHRVTASGDWSLGRLSAVTRDPDSGQMQAAANPRGAQGYAVGR